MRICLPEAITKLAMTEHRILKPGRNCWRIEHAERVAFLIDGNDYFRALYDGNIRARHLIQILAWDIDSRFELVRDMPQPSP
jgi:phospholipase D1/2